MILLHGFMEWAYTWRRNFHALARFGRVVAVDLKGFGLTWRSHGGSYSLGAQAELVCRFMDSLKIQRALLVGHSMGGEIAMRLSLRHPHRVLGLVLAAPSSYLHRQKSPLERWSLRVPWVNQWVVRLILMNRRFVVKALSSAYCSPRCWSSADVDAYLLPSRVPGAAVEMARLLREVDFGSEADRVRQVSHPALLIWGKEDRVVPMDHGRRMAQELEKSRLLLIPNCGHSPHEEDPDTFNKGVLEFLQRLPPEVRCM